MNDSIAKQKDKLEKQLDNTADALRLKNYNKKLPHYKMN